MKRLYDKIFGNEAANIGLEFVLAIPLLLTMILFGLESGLLYLDQQLLDDAMRSAARFAVSGAANQGFSERDFRSERESAKRLFDWLDDEVFAEQGRALCDKSCFAKGQGAFRMLLVAAHSSSLNDASGGSPNTVSCRVRLIAERISGETGLFSRSSGMLVDQISQVLERSGECQASFHSRLPDSIQMNPVERRFVYFEAARRGRRILISDDLVLRADAISGGLDG